MFVSPANMGKPNLYTNGIPLIYAIFMLRNSSVPPIFKVKANLDLRRSSAYVRHIKLCGGQRVWALNDCLTHFGINNNVRRITLRT